MHCKRVALFLWQAMRKIFYRHPLHESSQQPYELQTNISIFSEEKTEASKLCEITYLVKSTTAIYIQVLSGSGIFT